MVSIHSYADDLNIQAPGLPQPYNESQVPTPPMPNNTQADVRTVNPISQEMKQAPAIVGHLQLRKLSCLILRRHLLIQKQCSGC